MCACYGFENENEIKHFEFLGICFNGIILGVTEVLKLKFFGGGIDQFCAAGVISLSDI